MTEEMLAINAASNWLQYYEAYKRAYRTLLEARWGLGAATFAQQLHHTAVPDVSGDTAGVVSWAAFFQPSPATLPPFIPLLRPALTAVPLRFRPTSHLFF